jgi:hypothetical protein
VRSIPAVFAFKNGQPVDGFMGAGEPGARLHSARGRPGRRRRGRA